MGAPASNVGNALATAAEARVKYDPFKLVYEGIVSIGKQMRNPFDALKPDAPPLPPAEKKTPKPSADQLASLTKRRTRGTSALRIDREPGLVTAGGAGLRI